MHDSKKHLSVMQGHEDNDTQSAKEEESCFRDLEAEVSAWEKSRQIRAYVRAVTEAAIRKYGHIQKGSDLDRWLAWAGEQADRIDPIVRRIEDKGK